MPRQSRAYSSVLESQPAARRLVLVTGIVLAVFGAVPIATLPLSVSARGLLMAVWLAASGAGLGRRAYRYRRLTAVRFDASGGVEIRRNDGRWVVGSALPGSRIVANFVWLRFRDEKDRPHAELFVGDGRGSAAIRRLRVLVSLASTGDKH